MSRKPTLYQPPSFQTSELDDIRPLWQAHPLVTLITPVQGTPELHVSHVPVVIVEETRPRAGAASLTALFHLAQANPHTRALRAEDTGLTTAVFTGPHAYVSPRWYEAAPDNVPTWNYAVAHLSGRPQAITDRAEALEKLRAIALAFEPDWDLLDEVETSHREGLFAAIEVFAMPVVEVQGKIKMSQNRAPAERLRIGKALSERPDAGAQAAGQLVLSMARRQMTESPESDAQGAV